MEDSTSSSSKGAVGAHCSGTSSTSERGRASKAAARQPAKSSHWADVEEDDSSVECIELSPPSAPDASASRPFSVQPKGAGSGGSKGQPALSAAGGSAAPMRTGAPAPIFGLVPRVSSSSSSSSASGPPSHAAVSGPGVLQWRQAGGTSSQASSSSSLSSAADPLVPIISAVQTMGKEYAIFVQFPTATPTSIAALTEEDLDKAQVITLTYPTLAAAQRSHDLACVLLLGHDGAGKVHNLLLPSDPIVQQAMAAQSKWQSLGFPTTAEATRGLSLDVLDKTVLAYIDEVASAVTLNPQPASQHVPAAVTGCQAACSSITHHSVDFQSTYPFLCASMRGCSEEAAYRDGVHHLHVRIAGTRFAPSKQQWITSTSLYWTQPMSSCHVTATEAEPAAVASDIIKILGKGPPSSSSMYLHHSSRFHAPHHPLVLMALHARASCPKYGHKALTDLMSSLVAPVAEQVQICYSAMFGKPLALSVQLTMHSTGAKRCYTASNSPTPLVGLGLGQGKDDDDVDGTTDSNDDSDGDSSDTAPTEARQRGRKRGRPAPFSGTYWSTAGSKRKTGRSAQRPPSRAPALALPARTRKPGKSSRARRKARSKAPASSGLPAAQLQQSSSAEAGQGPFTPPQVRTASSLNPLASAFSSHAASTAAAVPAPPAPAPSAPPANAAAAAPQGQAVFTLTTASINANPALLSSILAATTAAGVQPVFNFH